MMIRLIVALVCISAGLFTGVAEAENLSSLASVQGGPSVAAKPAEPPAEIEITGSVQSKVKAKKFVVFAAKERCDATRGTTGAWQKVGIDPNVSMSFFLEIFVPQGTVGHICGAAFDENDKLVGFGAYAKNPVTFQGTGEVSIAGVVIPLKAVAARRKAMATKP